MMHFRVLIALLTILISHASLKADLKADIDRFAKPFVESGNLNAMTIGVIKGDERQIAGFGETVKGNGKAPNAETIFEIGSITKVFSGILLADMVRAGEVKLDDPVSKHLPKQFEIPKYEGKEITLLDLSTHGSALPRMPGNFTPKDPNNPYVDYTLDQMAAFLKDVELRRPIGKKYSYSNLAVALLGNALAHRAGKSYEALLKERVLTPLGMTDSTFELSDDHKKRLAKGYNASLVPHANWDLNVFNAAGGLRASTVEMFKFLDANMNGKSKLEETLQLSYKPQLKLPGGVQSMGLGWHIAGDGSTYWHNGQTGGYHAFAAFNRKTNVGVLIFTTGNPRKVDQLGFRLVQHFSGMNVKPIQFTKAMKVDPKVYDDYVGTYMLVPTFLITIERKGDQLFAQATGQQSFEVFPKAKDRFFYKVVEADLLFTRGDKGKVTHLTLFQNGREMKGARVK